MEWFRVYSSILDKPNVCGLDAETLGYWVLFLAVANRSRPRGTITANAEELAWSIHKDAKAVERALQVLINTGLLIKDGDVLRFHKWDQFQPPSTERANASREAKTQQSATDCNTMQQAATSATLGNKRNSSQQVATAATQEEKRKEEKIQNARSLARTHEGEQPDEIEPFEAPAPEPKIIPPGIRGPGASSPDAFALEEWAKPLGIDSNHDGYAYWARQQCDDVPAEWIKALLTDRVRGRSGLNRKPIAILNRTLGDWILAGRCPLIPESVSAPNGETRDRSPPSRREIQSKIQNDSFDRAAADWSG